MLSVNKTGDCTILLETGVEHEKAVEGIYVHRECTKLVVTFGVMEILYIS